MDVAIDVRRKKRTARENPYEHEFLAGDSVGAKRNRSGERAKKASEAELNRIVVKEQRKTTSNFEAQKKIVSSGEELTESRGGRRKAGGGQSRALVERKALSVSGSDKTNKNKDHVSLTCHQCKRNDKDGVVFCSKCKRKRYCYQCIANWYPGKSRQAIENACPFCCRNCNCKACLREYLVVESCDKQLDASTRLLRLQYLLFKALPVLRHIYGEQNYELAIESNLRGTPLTGKDITRSAIGISERLYWLDEVVEQSPTSHRLGTKVI